MKLADRQIIQRLGEIYDAQSAGGAASFAELTGSPSDNTALDSALDAKPTAELDADGTLAANSDAKVSTQKAVKTYVDAHSYTAPYLVYTALLTQTGDNAPVATVLLNTTGLTFTPSYSDIGKYRVAPSSPLPDLNKVAVSFGASISSGAGSLTIQSLRNDWGASNIDFSTHLDGTLTDGILVGTEITIKIFP